MDHICPWNNQEAARTVHNKKAVAAALFISFFGYTVAVILSEFKRGTKVRISKKTIVKPNYSSFIKKNF
jgi:hypothetical protein